MAWRRIGDKPLLLAPNRRQAIILTSAEPIHWRIYAALGGDELRASLTKTEIQLQLQVKIWLWYPSITVQLFHLNIMHIEARAKWTIFYIQIKYILLNENGCIKIP